jgi:flavin-dependent dehydrogenase
MPEEHDVIVVGGGPGGAAAAWALTRAGREVLVLDREAFPREKLCAGWITPEVLTDLEFTPADYPHRFLTFETLDVAVRGHHVTLRSPQHSIRRYEFDAWLLERSGAPVCRHRVRDVRRDGDGFVLDDRFRCRYLVGAGGTRCPVYRSLFRDARPRDRRLQVVTRELEYPVNDAGADCRLWFFDDGLPGYGWLVPKADGYLNVGVGALAGRLKARGDDIHRHWRLLLERIEREELADPPPEEPGGYSYFMRARHQGAHHAGSAYLVGDAAGLSTRDLCEGIGPAVRSGLRAAGSIVTGTPYDLTGIEPHTLGHPVLRLGLDFAFTRLRA